MCCFTDLKFFALNSFALVIVLVLAFFVSIIYAVSVYIEENHRDIVVIECPFPVGCMHSTGRQGPCVFLMGDAPGSKEIWASILSICLALLICRLSVPSIVIVIEVVILTIIYARLYNFAIKFCVEVQFRDKGCFCVEVQSQGYGCSECCNFDQLCHG